jgi:hypothetical protein
MSNKFQIPHSLRDLRNAVVAHLDRFKNLHREDFRYVKQAENGIELFGLVFARVWGSRGFDQQQSDLGLIKLRRLNSNLTELVMEDSLSLEVGPDLFLNAEFVIWGEGDEDAAISLEQCETRAAGIFEHFKTIHHLIRETVLEGLREDHLLGQQKVKIESDTNKGAYVHKSRIALLRQLRSTDFDLQRLIRLCEELKCSAAGAHCATAALVRAIIDHVPPIFGGRTFAEVANNIGGKSTKASLLRLETSSRNIADSVLHQQIRKREVVPNSTQVNFSNDLDVLLGEVVRRLS